MSKLINYGIYASTFRRPSTGEETETGFPPYPGPNAKLFVEGLTLDADNFLSSSLDVIVDFCAAPESNAFCLVGTKAGVTTVSLITLEDMADFSSVLSESLHSLPELPNASSIVLLLKGNYGSVSTHEFLIHSTTGQPIIAGYATENSSVLGWETYLVELPMLPDTTSINMYGGDAFYGGYGDIYYAISMINPNGVISVLPSPGYIEESGEISYRPINTGFLPNICNESVVRHVYTNDFSRMYILTKPTSDEEPHVNKIYQFFLPKIVDPQLDIDHSGAILEGICALEAGVEYISLYVHSDSGTSVTLCTENTLVHGTIQLEEIYDDYYTFSEFSKMPVDDNTSAFTAVSKVQGFEESDWSSCQVSHISSASTITILPETTNRTLEGQSILLPKENDRIFAGTSCSGEAISGILGPVTSEEIIIPQIPDSVSNAVFAGQLIDMDNPSSIVFSPDGTVLICTSSSREDIYKYHLTTPWDISSAVRDEEQFIEGIDNNNYYGVASNPEGTVLTLVGDYNVLECNLSTPWSLASINVAHSVPTNTVGPGPYGMTFGDDGHKAYIADRNLGGVHCLYLNTPYRISSSYSSISISLPDTSSIRGVALNNDGSQLFVSDYDRSWIRQYSLTVPWDITSWQLHLSEINVYNSSGTDGLQDITIDPSGANLYIAARRGNDPLAQLRIPGTVNGSASGHNWSADISSLSLPEPPTKALVQEPILFGLALAADFDSLQTPEATIVLPEPMREEWLGNCVRSLYPKIVTEGSRALSLSAVTSNITELGNAYCFLTKEEPGFRDTSGLTPPIIVEDFESDTPKIEFVGDWAITDVDFYSGSRSLASTNQGQDGSTSTTLAAIQLVTPSRISFWWRVSSERNYDKLTISINNVPVIIEMSGDLSWMFYSTDILQPGTATIEAEYTKDSSEGDYDDTAFIDEITIDSMPLPGPGTGPIDMNSLGP